VTAFVRIAWPLSIGIGGRLPSESVAALPRIPHWYGTEMLKVVTDKDEKGNNRKFVEVGHWAGD